MLTIQMKLNGNLQELVPRTWRVASSGPAETCVVRTLAHPTTVKDFLEAIGIPHCEIGSVLADGNPLELDTLLNRDTQLVVDPVAPWIPDPLRFICDQHLGSLTRLLRIMGFDTAYGQEWKEPEIARKALNQDRVVLSRNRRLLKRKTLPKAMLIRSHQTDVQVTEVLRRFDLAEKIAPFSRCPHCNGTVAPVPKEKVRDDIPPRTRVWLDDFYQCAGCRQLYWEGTHVTTLKRRIETMRQAAKQPPSRAAP